MITQPELMQVTRLRPLELVYNVPRPVSGAEYRVWRIRPEGMDVDDTRYYPFGRVYDAYVEPGELTAARQKVEAQIRMMLDSPRHTVYASSPVSVSDVYTHELERPYWVVAVDRFRQIYMYRCRTAVVQRQFTKIIGIERCSPCTNGHFSPGGFVEDQAAFDVVACHPVHFSKPSYYDNNF